MTVSLLFVNKRLADGLPRSSYLHCCRPVVLNVFSTTRILSNCTLFQAPCCKLDATLFRSKTVHVIEGVRASAHLEILWRPLRRRALWSRTTAVDTSDLNSSTTACNAQKRFSMHDNPHSEWNPLERCWVTLIQTTISETFAWEKVSTCGITSNQY